MKALSRRIFSRTPLAWRNVTHKKVALAISLTAVSFAVLIMFMELGFLAGLFDSQTALVNILRADLVMVSRARHTLVTHEDFPREKLEQAAGFPAVQRTIPLYTEDGRSYIRHPDTGVENAIRVIACDPEESVFQHKGIEKLMEGLRSPGTVIIDVKSRRFFGSLRKGQKTELANRYVEVIGNFSLSADYFWDGNIVTSSDTFFTLFPHRQLNRVMLGLIQLKPGRNPQKVRQEMNDILGGEVEVFTLNEIMDREKQAWQEFTPAGYVFTMGLLVGLIIGVIICYQILYTDIVDHLPQFATLKALGYRNISLVVLVLRQALILGLLGFIPSIFFTILLYNTLTALTGITMVLTLGRILFILGLTVIMCLISGFLAVKKALTVDPAELF